MRKREDRRSAGGFAVPVGLALTLAACMGAGSVPASPAGERTTHGAVPADPSAEARAVAELVNRHRATVGCAPLRWDERAATAAQAHTDEMARRGVLTHAGADGSSASARLERQGIGWRAVAENVARNPGGAGDVVSAWLRSPGHRANIENCAYTHHGVGARGQWWTHDFFTPAS